MRLEPWGGNESVAVISAAAIWTGAHRLTVSAASVSLDGQPFTLATGMTLDDGSTVETINGMEELLLLRLPTGERVFVGWYASVEAPQSILRVQVFLDPANPKNARGLLGNADGDTTNDLAVRGGAVLAQPVSNTDLYGAYADSWRVTDATSRFDYAPGKSSASYIVPGFPSRPATVATLTPEEYDAAKASCTAAGVAPSLLDGCVVDVALTGDARFAAAAAAVQEPKVVMVGHYSANFENGAGPEWSVNVIGKTPGSTRGVTSFLGPLTNGSGTLRLGNLAPHTQLALSFDLYVIGPWDGAGPDLIDIQLLDPPTTLLHATFANQGTDQSFPGAYPDAHSAPRTGAAEVDSLGYAADSVYHLIISAEAGAIRRRAAGRRLEQHRRYARQEWESQHEVAVEAAALAREDHLRSFVIKKLSASRSIRRQPGKVPN